MDANYYPSLYKTFFLVFWILILTESTGATPIPVPTNNLHNSSETIYPDSSDDNLIVPGANDSDFLLEKLDLVRNKGKPTSPSVIPPQAIPPSLVQLSLPTKPNVEYVPSAPVIISKPTKPDVTFVKPPPMEVQFVKPPPQTVQKPMKPDITIVPVQKPQVTLPSLPDLTIVKPPMLGGGGGLPVIKPPIATPSPIINKLLSLIKKIKHKLHAITGINIQFDKPEEPISIMPIFDKLGEMSAKVSKYYNKLEDFFEVLIMDTPFRSMRLDDSYEENPPILYDENSNPSQTNPAN